MKLLKGGLCLFFMLFASLLLAVPTLCLAIVKWLLPASALEDRLSRVMETAAEWWVILCKTCYYLIHRPRWQVTGIEQLRRDRWYLLIANHQSWVDISVLAFQVNGRIPFYRFFAKHELIWLPILGQACWVLGFPLMKRYSAEAVAQNPELRGVDRGKATEACRQLTRAPATMVSFAEGTRFTQEKRKRQQSPFAHLLTPKAGGIACVVEAFGEQLQEVLDVTIIYPQGAKGFWAFLCGQIEDVRIDVQIREIPDVLRQGDYQNSPEQREAYRQWLMALWEEKDQRIAAVIESSVESSKAQTTLS